MHRTVSDPRPVLFGKGALPAPTRRSPDEALPIRALPQLPEGRRAVAHEVGVPLELATVRSLQGRVADAPRCSRRTPTARSRSWRTATSSCGNLRPCSRTSRPRRVARISRRRRPASGPRSTAGLSWQLAHFGPAIRKVAFERIVKKLAGLGAPDEADGQGGIEEFAVDGERPRQSLGDQGVRVRPAHHRRLRARRRTPRSPRAAVSTSIPIRRRRRGSGACSPATA